MTITLGENLDLINFRENVCFRLFFQETSVLLAMGVMFAS
jgi:hypothetical protein